MTRLFPTKSPARGVPGTKGAVEASDGIWVETATATVVGMDVEMEYKSGLEVAMLPRAGLNRTSVRRIMQQWRLARSDLHRRLEFGGV